LFAGVFSTMLNPEELIDSLKVHATGVSFKVASFNCKTSCSKRDPEKWAFAREDPMRHATAVRSRNTRPN
jgi:hypothetical protein